MRFGSLFTGIGGFDLGFERAGMECAWQVEIDAACQDVERRHWPNVKRFGDVRNAGRDNLDSVDVICGGFPCQDLSVAGKRAGLAGERSGLWYEFARIIREIKPRWVVVENVRNLLSIDNGDAFGIVLRDLASSGYDATWRVLRASDFGAIHRRERIFLVANGDRERIERFWEKPICRVAAFSWCENVRGIEDLRNRPDIPESLIRRKGDGVSARLDQLGNALIPQIAEWIGQRIIELDNLTRHNGPLSGDSQILNVYQAEVGKPVAVGA